jgi:hypothetical protein
LNVIAFDPGPLRIADLPISQSRLLASSIDDATPNWNAAIPGGSQREGLMPPVVADELASTQLPIGWTWSPNTQGGFTYMSPVDGVCVRTYSDYALHGFDLDDLVAEFDQLNRSHRPGYRRTHRSRKLVFGAGPGATVHFDWAPHNDSRAYRGVADFVVSQGSTYSAEALWPVGAPEAVVDDALDIMRDLKIATESDEVDALAT